MSNSSLTVYTDKIDILSVLHTIQDLTKKEVIVNGIETFDDVYNRHCQVITIINIEKKDYSKLKNRVAFKKLKEEGHLKHC